MTKRRPGLQRTSILVALAIDVVLLERGGFAIGGVLLAYLVVGLTIGEVRRRHHRALR